MSQVSQPQPVLLVRKSTPMADDALARQLTALLNVAKNDATENGRDGVMKVLGVEGNDVVVYEVQALHRKPSQLTNADTVEKQLSLLLDFYKPMNFRRFDKNGDAKS